MQIASHKPIRISCQCVCRLVSPSRRDGDERVGPGCNRSKKQANPLAQAVSFIGRYLPIQKRLLTSLIICQGPVCFFHLVENHCKERKTKIEGGPILCSRSVGQCKRTSAVPSRTWEVVVLVDWWEAASRPPIGRRNWALGLGLPIPGSSSKWSIQGAGTRQP